VTDDERFRWRSCLSKTTWESRGMAKKSAQRARDRGDTNVRAYRCPLCCHYHIGHPPTADAELVKAAEQRRHEKDKQQWERARLAWQRKTFKAGYAV
jgi:hypothetical protein